MSMTPYGLSSSFFNWWRHLAGSPEKQVQLVEKAARDAARLAIISRQQLQSGPADPRIWPLGHEARFDAPEWQHWPFNLFCQNFLLTQQWWSMATNDVDGLSHRDEQTVSFAARQILNMMSPSNVLWTNPEVIAQTTREGGANLIRGAQNLIQDWERAISGEPPVGAENYIPGRDVAITPGKVVFRSHLLELIQYSPQTDTVVPEPIMIVPAWIMKYYILDLSPHNSLVLYLVEQGFTVFMLSWRNPDAEDRDLGMNDYLDAVGEVLNEIGEIVPDTPVHAVGYCLGGTLLSITAAQMARDQDDRLKTLTLFAAQTDFEDPGELQLFLGESDVSPLEHLMADHGYLDSKLIVDTVMLLRSEDLIWPRYVHGYLLGERQGMDDQIAWSVDSPRMPCRMYSEYLRRMFLNNELAQGHYEVDGKPVAISDISVPVFCVSTIDDYVAPWQSVYKLHRLVDTDLTFVLTTGDHIDGIVCGLSDAELSYQIATTPYTAHRAAPDEWRAQTPLQDGSWWFEWVTWLRGHSGETKNLPRMGAAAKPFVDAPGTYVCQR